MKPRKRKYELSDKELLEYVLGSIETIQEYLRKYSFKKFENDLLIQDACCHRMHCIGLAALDLSEEIKQKYHSFPWFFYTIWTTENSPFLIWDLVNEKYEENDDFGSMASLFIKLEEVYLNEYFPDKVNKTNKKIKSDIEWTTEYKYPIKSNRSFWTVKK